MLAMLMSPSFLCNIFRLWSEYSNMRQKTTTWEHGCILPCTHQWRCNYVEYIFLPHFGPLSFNCESSKCHSLPGYYSWPYSSLLALFTFNSWQRCQTWGLGARLGPQVSFGKCEGECKFRPFLKCILITFRDFPASLLQWSFITHQSN